jgi:hypothetical protein
VRTRHALPERQSLPRYGWLVSGWQGSNALRFNALIGFLKLARGLLSHFVTLSAQLRANFIEVLLCCLLD